MPVHASHTVQWGSTGRSVLIFAHDGAGAGVTDLGPGSAGATAAYVREGETMAVAITLGNRLAEVDPRLVPGVYRLVLPDDLFAAGSPHAMLLVGFDDATVDPIEFELVAYDPCDGSCIGMAQLGDRKRHEFLRRALPRFTEMEYEAGTNRERQLSDFLDSYGPRN